MRKELVSMAPASPARLAVRGGAIPKPARGEVLVRVKATSVNPIDVKRAAGYRRRLLGLKGAATFPLSVGNDVAGQVEGLGEGVTAFAPGARVFGLVGTGKRGGADASLLAVAQNQLLVAPDDADLHSLAVLPYSFTTMWLAWRPPLRDGAGKLLSMNASRSLLSVSDAAEAWTFVNLLDRLTAEFDALLCKGANLPLRDHATGASTSAVDARRHVSVF